VLIVIPAHSAPTGRTFKRFLVGRFFFVTKRSALAGL
jgi:hypothetical protein